MDAPENSFQLRHVFRIVRIFKKSDQVQFVRCGKPARQIPYLQFVSAERRVGEAVCDKQDFHRWQS